MIVGLEDYKKKIKEINSAPIQKSQSLSSNYDLALNIANRAVKREEDKKKQLQTWMNEYENKTYDEMKKISSGDLDPSDPKTEFIKSYTALKGEQEEKEKMLSLDITEETTKINTMVANERKAHEIAKSAINAKNKAHEEARLSGKTDAESKEIANSVDISQYMNQLKELGYNTYDISFELSRAQSDLKKATMLQKVTNYSQNADFNEKSKAVETEFSNDEVYKIINLPKEKSEKLDKTPRQILALEMNDDEIKMYTYLYNTEGYGTALEYFDYLEQELEFRQGDELYQTLKDTKIAKYAVAPAAGVVNFVEGTIGYFDKERPITSTQYAASAIREDLGTVEKGAFDVLQSAGNMAPSILISYATAGIGSAAGMSAQAAETAGQIAGSASMGLSAAGNAYQNALKEGRDRMQARAYGNLVGLSEFGMQYAIGGVSKLGGKAFSKWTAKINAIDNAFVRVSTKYAGSVLSEGTEEALQEIIDPIFKTVVFDDKYEPAQIEDIMYTAIVGGITGGIFESGKIISPEISRIKNDSLTRSLLSTEAKNILNDMVKDTAAKVGAGKILNYAIQNEAVGAKVTKQAAFEAMSDSGLSPSSAFEARLKDSAKTELSESGLQKETVSLINGLIDKFDTAFASAWYGSEGISSARVAASVYVKASAAADVVGAAIITNDAVNNESLSENQKKKALRKANALLPITSKVDIKSGTSKEIADRIMQSANNYLNLIDKSTADVSQNYMTDMVSTLNEALENTSGIDSDAKSALVDLLLYGKVDENINTVLADPDVTEFLSRILGTHINSSTKVSDIVRKAKNMLSVYKAGKGLEYNSVSKQKYARAQTILKSLEAAGIKNSKIIQGFLNTVYNGKLTEAHARAIMENEKAFDLFIKTTGANLDVNSTLQDVMDAADLIAGFKLSGEFSQYYNKRVASIVESDTLVPDGEVGIYDADNGRIILNSKATQEQKNAYILAHKILTESSSASDTQFSLSNSFSSKDKIIVDMDENARAKILKKRNVELAEISSDVDNVLENNFEFFNEKYDKTDAQSIIKKIAEYFNVFSGYSNKEFNIEFEFGARNLRKSVHTQKGNYHLYAQMLSNFSTIIENAVGVEVHNRNKEGYKPDETLKNVYVLCSAFRNKTEIVPVKLEIKEFLDKPNRLYVAITLESIKKDRFMATGVPIESDSLRNSPVSISISELFSKINPEDTDFTKYIPDSMLTNEQKKVLKEKGLLKSIAKTYASDFKSNDGDKISFEGKSNFSASLSERILDYISKNQNTDALANKIAKNFGAFMRADQSRLIGSDLTPENINNEIAAEFLTKLFTDKELLNKVANDDLALIVEIAYHLKNECEKAGVEAPSGFKIVSELNAIDEILEDVQNSSFDYQKNIESVASMEAVSILDGTEFAKGEKDLITQVSEYFEVLNNAVENSEIGTVNITKRGIKDSIAHGLGRNKAIAFKAVPDVIKNGKIIDYQPNWKDRGYETFVVAAPILINNQEYLCGVVIEKSTKETRYYLHEVLIEKRTETAFKTGADNEIGEPGAVSSPSVISLLKKVETVKKKTTKEKESTNTPKTDDADEATGKVKKIQLKPPESPKDYNGYLVKTANDVFDIIKNSDPLVIEAVLKNRRKNGEDISFLSLTEMDERFELPTEETKEIRKKIIKLWRDVKRGFIDSGEAIHRISKLVKDETIYSLYNNLKQYRATVNVMLSKRAVNLEGEETGKSLIDIFSPVLKDKKLYREFENYLQFMNNYARYNNDTPFWSESKEQSLYEAKEILKRHPEFESIASEVYGYMDNLLDIRVQAGLMTEEHRRIVKTNNPYYVPAWVAQGDKKGKPYFVDATKVYKTVKRSKKAPEKRLDFKLADTLHSIQIQTEQVVKEAKMNLLANGIIDSLKRVGDVAEGPFGYDFFDKKTSDFVTHVTRIAADGTPVTYDMNSSENFTRSDEATGNRLIFFVDGVRYTADISKELFNAFNTVEYESPTPTLYKTAAAVGSTFKAMVTSHKPTFFITNGAKDFLDAILFSREPEKLLWNLPQAYYQIASKGKYWKMYEAMGGVSESWFDFDKEIKITSNKAINARKASEAISSLNRMVEQAPRLAEFMTKIKAAEKKAAKNKTTITYNDKVNALYAAADVTVNFNRCGTYTKVFNSTLVPFLNPGIQGASKFVRMFTECRDLKDVTRLAVKLVIIGFGCSQINNLLHELAKLRFSDDDEEYEQLTDYQKSNNIIIRIKDGKYLKIPMGRSVVAVSTIAGAVVDKATGKEVDTMNVIQTAINAVAPPNPFTDNLYMNLENAINNKTWYGGDIDKDYDKRPEYQKYDENTDIISVYLGKVLNYSPKKINYIIDAYTGVYGDVFLPMLTPKYWKEPWTVLGSFLEDEFVIDSVTSNKISSEYYSLIDKHETAKADAYNDDTIAETVTLRYLGTQTDLINGLYKQIADINAGTGTVSEKAERTHEIKALINATMLSAMQKQETVYKATENIRSKYAYEKDGLYYNEVGEELTEEKYNNIIYREVNKEVFGAEYALQTYNVKVYEDASKAVKDGASFDVYYDAYFGTKNIEGDIDYEKGTIKTGSARKNKWKHIDSMNASQSERAAVAKVLFDISEDKIKQATASGISMYEYIDFVCDTGTYKSDDDHTKKEKVLTYINRMQLSAKQKDTLYLLAGYSEKNIYSTPWR